MMARPLKSLSFIRADLILWKAIVHPIPCNSAMGFQIKEQFEESPLQSSKEELQFKLYDGVRKCVAG